ncbi:hypothetical protein [uncultured Rhodoblastus sp.]|uniref:hypothetical protein n=1 Tax=uncultured Rhodoblastus sp. TaxID=543037 RepID=UPI0025D00559|nr:hypothetical protein [uncultured Rhodoblastus sp.]
MLTDLVIFGLKPMKVSFDQGQKNIRCTRQYLKLAPSGRSRSFAKGCNLLFGASRFLDAVLVFSTLPAAGRARSPAGAGSDVGLIVVPQARAGACRELTHSIGKARNFDRKSIP